MAYSSDGLNLVYQTVGGTYRKWVYIDLIGETNSTLVGSGFFSDGAARGMRKGELVDVVQMTSPKAKQYQVASLSGDAATVAAVTAIS